MMTVRYRNGEDNTVPCEVVYKEDDSHYLIRVGSMVKLVHSDYLIFPEFSQYVGF